MPFSPSPAPTPSAALQHLRRRQRRLWSGIALLAAVGVGMTLLDMRGHWVSNHQEAHAEAELYARLAEGQVSRTVDATGSSLRMLAAHPLVNEGEPHAADSLLTQQLVGQAQLRSLSLLDEGGRVLASSSRANAGLQVDLDRLGRPPQARTLERLGPLQPGRDLHALPAAGADATAATAEVAVLPLLRAVDAPSGRRWLVALLNVDYLANQNALLTAGHPVQVLTLSLDGRVIDGAGHVRSGTEVRHLGLYTQFLPDRENGQYEGPGADGSEALVAFRATRNWPLVLVAQYPTAPLVAAWRAEAQVIAGIGLAALVLLAAMGWVLQRSLRREFRDLEALNTLHDSIARSEQRLQLALVGAGHGPWDADLVKHVCSLSAEFMALLGHAREPAQWTLAHWQAQLHPDDREPAKLATRRHLMGETLTLELELRVRTAKGEWRWFACAAKRTGKPDAEGRFPRLVGTLTDVDRRKRAEAALLSSEARQQAILRSALDGIITIDADGRVVDFNPAAEAMFGVDATAARGQPMHELIVPHRHRDAHQAGMARHKRTGEGPVLNQRIQVEGLRADGSEFPMELAVVPVRTHDGQVFTATVRDISERLKVEAELRESQAILDKVGHIAGVGGWTLDLRTQRPQWTAHTAVIHDRPPGYQPVSLEEAVGYYAPGAADRMAEAVRQSVDSGEGFDLELPLITAKGRSIWVRALGRAEYVDGVATRLVGAFQDVTTRVVAEQELLQARSREVQVGARIQQTLLVDRPDQRLPGLWMSSMNQSSQGIDGDFVELIRVGDRGVDVIVGDVMGKGVAAALMGAATKMQLSRCFTELLVRADRDGSPPEPAEVLSEVHRAMTPRLQELDAFVTLSYLRLDVQAGQVTWVGCGHEEPMVLRASGEALHLRNQHPPLGVLSDQSFQQDRCPLALDDAVFLCSDGAADALLPNGERLGRERVEALLQDILRQVKTPAAALHALRREIDATGAQLTDDLTLALACISGDPQSASRRELSAGLADVVHVRGLVENRAQKAGLDAVTASLFAVACVEAYTNVVRHTVGRPAQAPVELVVRVLERELCVDLVSLGEPFEPPSVPEDTNFDDFPEGGFGLTIMAQASDRVAYHHAHGVNTVSLMRWRP